MSDVGVRRGPAGRCAGSDSEQTMRWGPEAVDERDQPPSPLCSAASRDSSAAQAALYPSCVAASIRRARPGRTTCRPRVSEACGDRCGSRASAKDGHRCLTR